MVIGEGYVLGGRYRLVRPLRTGTTSVIWVADHLALNSRVAVKLVDADAPTKDAARARFLREAAAAARMRSPHVVQILDTGVEEGRPFMVSELLDGEDLTERLRRQGRLAPERVVALVTQTARALTRAHAANIVLGDLDAAGIFLVPNDDDEVIKILDFGVARPADAEANLAAAPDVGTLETMSPEQLRGDPLDRRSDLWSLAVIAFQCTTGKLPFEASKPSELLARIGAGAPSASAERPELPSGVDAWFARALASDPADRFQSARDMAQALGEALEVLPRPSLPPASDGARRAPGVSSTDFSDAPPRVETSAPREPRGAARPASREPWSSTPPEPPQRHRAVAMHEPGAPAPRLRARSAVGCSAPGATIDVPNELDGVRRQKRTARLLVIAACAAAGALVWVVVRPYLAPASLVVDSAATAVTLPLAAQPAPVASATDAGPAVDPGTRTVESSARGKRRKPASDEARSPDHTKAKPRRRLADDGTIVIPHPEE